MDPEALINKGETMESAIRSNTDEQNNVSNKHRYPDKPVPDIITTGFFIVDRDWTVRHWNKAAENLLAVRAKDIIGLNLWEVLGRAVPVEFFKAYHKVFLRDNPLAFVSCWEEMGNWLDVVAYHFDGGLSVSFKSRDRPAHLATPEQRLQVLNELYRYVTEVTNDCLWKWDLPAKEFFWIDGGHRRILGYPIVNAIVPQHFWENCLHPDDKYRVLSKLNKVLSTGSATSWEDEYRFRKANGEYAYVRDRAHIIFDEDNRASRMIGATQDVTARRLAEIQLLESEKRLGQERLARQKQVTDTILLAHEQERAEIGKELHDNLSQILGAAKMYIELAKTDETNREICLNKSSVFLVTVIESIRKISKKLILPGRQIMGLTESINILLDDLAFLNPIKIEFDFKGVDDEYLNEKLRLDIFRMVQEQLNNIMKHANAGSAKISLMQQASHILLCVADDGNGCNWIKGKEGTGIMNIRSRAESHNGTVTILSGPGQGFELKVELPLARMT
jgi:signal transduction histidine kinase